MSIYEYNEEYVRKSLFEDGEKSGYSKGVSDGEKAGYDKGEKAGYSKGEKAGYMKGENKLGRLISLLLSEGKQEEARLVSEDESARQEYYQKYHISD